LVPVACRARSRGAASEGIAVELRVTAPESLGRVWMRKLLVRRSVIDHTICFTAPPWLARRRDHPVPPHRMPFSLSRVKTVVARFPISGGSWASGMIRDLVQVARSSFVGCALITHSWWPFMPAEAPSVEFLKCCPCAPGQWALLPRPERVDCLATCRWVLPFVWWKGLWPMGAAGRRGIALAGTPGSLGGDQFERTRTHGAAPLQIPMEMSSVFAL